MDIQGFSDYLIYPDGKVFTKKQKKYLSICKTRTGYEYVKLISDEGKKRKLNYIHRLIAIHYITNPDNLKEVDHINRIKDDNRIENLRWATRSQNNLNVSMYRSNKVGHKNIIYRSDGYYVYNKSINKKIKITKTFKTIKEALCYKFIMILKFKSNHLI